MAEERSEQGRPSWLNLNALLALVTLGGGLWFFSQRLASDRPLSAAGGLSQFVGDQTIEARLWEDPFEERQQKTDARRETNLWTLVDQIRERSTSNQTVLILPIMVAGGQYSEDRESRIRSRFAIVSALGVSGYAPEDAEHIGSVKIRWPNSREVRLALRSAEYSPCYLWDQDCLGQMRVLPLGIDTTETMDVRYEWYRPRTFYGHPSSAGLSKVLLVWLDESYFEDIPLVRFPLLFELLTDPNRLKTFGPPKVALIGPRRSSTLRAMIPGKLSGTTSLTNYQNTCLVSLATGVLASISIYCATPSAMDEVLIEQPKVKPRESVGEHLKRTGFNSFQNFAVTDGQLAEEALQELELRGCSLTNYNNHVAMITEWDTFYGRMLALTYQAELATQQGKYTNRLSYVEEYRKGSNIPPTNFHSFVYLRGLDGQTLGGDDGLSDAGANGRIPKTTAPKSFEDLRNWVPEANRAEGRAQFDYLNRLGDQLAELEKQLQREERGHLKAIGIAGSDVYDTLLILQALHKRFSHLLFFTTDLDARFLDSREREWARNLIVVSGYGLRLVPHVQREAAPFRDSTQTAQFTAGLAALGNDLLTNLDLSARRFEIGNRVAVDLSVTNTRIGTNQSLHPMRLSEAYNLGSVTIQWKLIMGLVIGLLILAGTCWYWKPLWRLTVGSLQYFAEPLKYSEEDVGGPHEGATLLNELIGSRLDPRAKGIVEGWLKEDSGDGTRMSSGTIATKSVTMRALWNRFCGWVQSALIGAQLRPSRGEPYAGISCAAIVRVLNRLLKQGEVSPSFRGLGLRDSSVAFRFPTLQAIRRLRERVALRQEFEMLFGFSPGSTDAPTVEGAQARAAKSARAEAIEIYRLRRHGLRVFWICVATFGTLAALMGYAIWEDLRDPEGEPVSFINGTSAWPAQIVRLVVFVGSVGLLFGLSHRLHETFCELTRRFRFNSKRPHPNDGAVEGDWREYGIKGRLSSRVWRILPLFIAYVVLLFALMALFDQPITHPLRGVTIQFWNGFLLVGSVIGFLVLTFMTIDAARLCHWLVSKLRGDGFSETTRRHFSQQRGDIQGEYIEEWIRLQLIAELTDRVGGLVDVPCWLLLMLLVARNSWWDAWPWPMALVTVFTLNLVLALVSVAILQRAAQAAKQEAEERLTVKVRRLQAHAAPSAVENEAIQTEKLLEEIRGLRQGAFASFWDNPVVGALFVSTGGTTALHLLILFMGR